MSSERDYHLQKYQDGFKGSGNSMGANSNKHYYNLKERNELEMRFSHKLTQMEEVKTMISLKVLKTTAEGKLC